MGRPVAVALILIGGLLLGDGIAGLAGADTALILAADGLFLVAFGLLAIDVDKN